MRGAISFYEKIGFPTEIDLTWKHRKIYAIAFALNYEIKTLSQK